MGNGGGRLDDPRGCVEEDGEGDDVGRLGYPQIAQNVSL